MGIGSTLCQLGRLLDEWDRDGVTIESIRVAGEAGLEAGANQTAEVTLSFPMQSFDSGPVIGCTPEVTDEGSIVLGLETNVAVPDATKQRFDVEATDATVDSDGTVTITVSTTVAAADEDIDGEAPALDGQASERERWSNVDDEGQTAGDGRTASESDSDSTETGEQAGETTPGEQADGKGEERAERDAGTDNQEETDDDERSSSTTGRSRDVPPFRDPDLLQEVYETHDTFAEMAEALDMDVTGETVRRYMIDYDIHQPNSYRTNGTSGSARSNGQSTDADGGQEVVVLPDGIGLPENVSVEDLIETVNRSNTIYEVKEDLGLERKEAHEMLKELNLIDLVLGRLSNDAGREITREDVVERLRDVSEARRQDNAVPAA